MADEEKGGGSGPRFRRSGDHRADIHMRLDPLWSAVETYEYFMRLVEAQREYDQRTGHAESSPIHAARHRLGPWFRLTPQQQYQLVRDLPTRLIDDLAVPPEVRVQCSGRALSNADYRQDVIEALGETITTSPWVLRMGPGRVYATTDPGAAEELVVHVLHPPYDERMEAEAFEALRQLVAKGEHQTKDRVGVIVALPESTAADPGGRDLLAAFDFFDAAALLFPKKSLIVSCGEGERETWDRLVGQVNMARMSAGIDPSASCIPMLSHLEAAPASPMSGPEIQAAIRSDQLTMAAHCAFTDNLRAQGEQDRAANVQYSSHVLEAAHFLEPWNQLSDSHRERLVEKFPHLLAESPSVPPDVRARCCAAVLNGTNAQNVDVPEVTAGAEWALRLRHGRIYGTGDPRSASRVVMHILEPPYTERDEAEAYAALREILTPREKDGTPKTDGVSPVGIMVALPDPDPRYPGWEYGAVHDAVRAAAVGFPETPVTISTHENARTYGQTMVAWINQDRATANFTAFASYEPVLATLAGLGSQLQPGSVPGAHLIPEVRKRPVARRAPAAPRPLSEIHELPWQIVLGSQGGNRGTRAPRLN